MPDPSVAPARCGSFNRSLLACVHSDWDPASRFRVMQYLPALRNAGWRITLRRNQPQRYYRPKLPNAALARLHRRAVKTARAVMRQRDIRTAARHDLVWVNRDLLRADPGYEARLVTRNPRYVFDVDDAVYLNDTRGHFAWCCRHAAWVMAGNDEIAAQARRHTDRVSVFPTVVDTGRYLVSETGDGSGHLRVGWIGSSLSIEQTLMPHMAMFRALQQQLDFTLVVMTRPRPIVDIPGLDWTYVEWSASRELALNQYMDIGIMPLEDTPMQRAKCGLKILQYMAAGIPAVASPVGVNTRLIDHGRSGFLAADSGQWASAIHLLQRDDAARERIAQQGRAFCRQHYSVEQWSPRLLELFNRLSSRPA